MEEQLEKVAKLRKAGQNKEVLEILTSLNHRYPDNPKINHQIAWTYDAMGEESRAVSYYKRAIEKGLSGQEKADALLGLGSTYRCLGKYEESLSLFNQAIKEFPDIRSFKVFRSLTLYNLKKYKESMAELLIQILDTTEDASIKSYERALRFYSANLDKKWD